MTNERNGHFQGFARLLWIQLRAEMMFGTKRTLAEQGAAMEQIIAQRAYDLVYFLLDKALYHSGSFDTGYGTPDEIAETIEHLPDLTEWPTTVD